MHDYNFQHLLQTSELYQQGAPLCPDAVVPTTEKQHWPLIVGTEKKQKKTIRHRYFHKQYPLQIHRRNYLLNSQGKHTFY